MTERRGFIRHFLGSLWRGITRVRIALSNLLFIAVVVLLFSLLNGPSLQPLPEKAALLLNPVGTVVDEKSRVDPLALLFSEPLPQEREVLMSDMIGAIRAAAEDPAITALVMDLGGLYSIGISKTGELAQAIEAFRESGKPVVARGDAFSQSQYLLAAQADTLSIHPMGDVLLEGFASYRWYFAEALEKLSVNVHVFKAGEYKSVAEPLLRNDMSPGEEAITQRWLDSLWAAYTADIETRRELEPGAIDGYIATFPARVEALGGDAAALALDAGLVDRVEPRTSAAAWLSQVVGATDESGEYVAVDFETYIARRQATQGIALGPKVALVHASGNILNGEQPAGLIGSDSLSERLQEAMDDDGIVAVVLRVDSGGGSAFASEVIRQQVLRVQAAGKPVVVSMGSVAASGGYWIAAPADEIWATPTTLTGSIGVFGALPTVDGALAKLGVSADGVGTTKFAGAFRSDLPMKPGVGDVYQSVIDGIHSRFVDLVAEGRDMPRERAFELASGTVWSGEHALEVGLVDQLGSLRDAVQSAANLAGHADDFSLVRLEAPLSPREALLRQLSGGARGPLINLQPDWLQGVRRATAPLIANLRVLARFDDPRGVYAHCLVCAAP